MALKRELDDKEDIKKIKKPARRNFVEVVDLENREKQTVFDAIPSECQPQFSNYQLVGDLVSIMILDSKNPLDGMASSWRRSPLSYNFTHAYWDSEQLKRSLKWDKKSAVARNVILSVGYKDCRDNEIGKHTLMRNIEKIIRKLRKKGCKELIITNVPPCALVCDQIEHWKYLQYVNEEIHRLCSKRDDTTLCDIFQIFCYPRDIGSLLRLERPEYVSFGEVNYNVRQNFYNMYCQGRTDLVTFSSSGKLKLRETIEDTIRLRRKVLESKIDAVVSTIILEDESDDETKLKKPDKPSLLDNGANSDDDDVIIIEDQIDCDNSENVIIIDEGDPTDTPTKDVIKTERPHLFLCECEKCSAEHNRLMSNFEKTIHSIKTEPSSSMSTKTEISNKAAETQKISITCEVQQVVKEEDPQRETQTANLSETNGVKLGALQEESRTSNSSELFVKKEESVEDIQNLNLNNIKLDVLCDLSIKTLNEVKKKILCEIEDVKDGIIKHEEVILDEEIICEKKTEELSNKRKCRQVPEKSNHKEKIRDQAPFKEEPGDIKREEVTDGFD